MRDAVQLERKQVAIILDEVTEDGTIRGYASVFGNTDLGGDIVMPGAFKRHLKALKGKPVKMLWDHNAAQPIGKFSVLEEDTRGLRVEGRVTPGVAKGAEILALVRDDVIDGMSIGFRTIKFNRDEETGIRSLIELELWEVSLVTFPMNVAATVDAVKTVSIEELREMTERELEGYLTGKRDAAGLSRSAAQALIKGGLPALRATRDAGEDAVHRMLKSVLLDMKTGGRHGT